MSLMLPIVRPLVCVWHFFPVWRNSPPACCGLGRRAAQTAEEPYPNPCRSSLFGSSKHNVLSHTQLFHSFINYHTQKREISKNFITELWIYMTIFYCFQWNANTHIIYFQRVLSAESTSQCRQCTFGPHEMKRAEVWAVGEGGMILPGEWVDWPCKGCWTHDSSRAVTMPMAVAIMICSLYKLTLIFPWLGVRCRLPGSPFLQSTREVFFWTHKKYIHCVQLPCIGSPPNAFFFFLQR